MWDTRHFVIRQKLLSIGKKYYVESPEGSVVAFAHKKPFKLREEIVVYSDESKARELFRAKQEQIFDFNATLAVADAGTGELLGYVGRKGWASILRDTWTVFDRERRQVAVVEEEGVLAIARRFFDWLTIIPKTYAIRAGGKEVAMVRERFRIIGDVWDLRIEDGAGIDPRLLVMSALLMDMMEEGKGA